MSTVTRGGIWLGILVVVWTFIMGLTGWYKDAVMLNAFWVVILIQIGVLVWALRKTAAAGNTYGKQVMSGLTISIIGGVIIFFGSLLFTSVVYPQYFTELQSVHEQMLRDAGTPESDMQRMLEAESATQTSFLQALFGFIGTVVTGIVVSAILGFFIRKK